MTDGPKIWPTPERFSIVVEYGKVVRASNIRPRDMIGNTLDEVFALVESRGGEIYPVCFSGWHTCTDWPNDVCGACEEGKSDKNARSAYSITLPGACRSRSGFLERSV